MDTLPIKLYLMQNSVHCGRLRRSSNRASLQKSFSQRTAVEMIMSMTAELDITAMRSFMESVILYPVDTTVSLSNGEQARVVENKPNAVLRPTVVGLKSGIVYNLSEDLTCASIVIQ